ncbi:MAG: hypothetical protein ACLUUG_06205 [Lachnospiraceae bacterium]
MPVIWISYTDGNLEAFFQLLANGDEGAKKRWMKYLDDLSLSIHNIRILFDGTVILGGYVGAYIGEYMEELNRRVDERNPFGDRAENYLRPCRYKVEATAAGAAIFLWITFWRTSNTIILRKSDIVQHN